ncbi:MAG: PDZ domain-containing protein [Planctomycetota bacterium]
MRSINSIHSPFIANMFFTSAQRNWLALFLIALMPLSLAADEVLAQEDAAASIQYEVDLADSKNHYLHITATIDVAKDQPQTELMMAVWTPGSYLVREYARHIDSMTIVDENGKELDYEKIKKNRWIVKHGDSKQIKLGYRLYCNEMTVRTNWVGLQYAMINGAPSFITVADRLDQPHIVELKMPRNWKRSATSLRQINSAHRYRAENFDELVDSPIVAGNIAVYPFTAGGVEHQLVNIGESGYWDGAKAATDLQRMVEEHQRMWGGVPYDRYLFLNMISESGGGLEHDNSTLIMTSRWSFRDERRYKSWLSLASHEFFHTWNVRRLRPNTLVRYDYENEVYTKSLWIAEGITSYYQDLALVRAGLITEKEYLERLSRDVEGVQRTEGRKKQSLTDSSYDTWIKYYRPDENSSNTRISYYSKGAVAAFLLDVRIRKLTDGEKSLDDVMQQMFEQYSKSGYTPEDFRKTASQVAGENLDDWFRKAIDSTEELDFSDVEFLGVAIPAAAKQTKASGESTDDDASTSTDEDSVDASAEESEDNADAKDDDDTKKPAAKSKGKPWVGLSTSGDSKVTISGVTPESPAYQAGINHGDELIAINDIRVTGSIDSRLKQFEIGDQLEFLIVRRGKLLRLKVDVGSLESPSWKLKYVSKPDDMQKEQKKNWLTVTEDED